MVRYASATRSSAKTRCLRCALSGAVRTAEGESRCRVSKELSVLNCAKGDLRQPVKATTENLTPKQELLLVALLATGEAKRAAEQAGVSETSAWRWLQLPTFQARYRQARRDLVEMAMSQLQADCGVAARVLREVAEDASVLASSRVAAAKTILELWVKPNKRRKSLIAFSLTLFDKLLRLIFHLPLFTPLRGLFYGRQEIDLST